jgi:hypothetical protein
MLTGFVRVRSCDGRELEVGWSAVRFSERGAHALLFCVGDMAVSEEEVVLGEKVTVLFAFIFRAGTGCFLNDDAGRVGFLFNA